MSFHGCEQMSPAQHAELSRGLAGSSVTGLPPAHSPLFDAARELLRGDGDRSAAISQIRESFPDATPAELDRLLRAAAVEVMP